MQHTYTHTFLLLAFHCAENKAKMESIVHCGYSYRFDDGNGYTITVTKHLTSIFCVESTCNGLVNCNARLYDPAVGRFLSPDPFVFNPLFSQDYNRYTYCRNNPLKYRDPNGEFIVTAIIVGAVIGAAVGGFAGYRIGRANEATGWGMAGYIFGGAAIGAVGGGVAGGVGAAVSGAISIGGFAGGAIAGGAAGSAGGFINSAGMSWLGGACFGQGLTNGLIGAGIGAVSGAALGGAIKGIAAVRQGNNFWSGRPSTTVPPASPQSAQPAGNVNTQQPSGANVPANSQPQTNNLPASSHPSNSGAIGRPEMRYLYRGEIVDRFGGTSQYSRFLSPQGTPIPARSLHPSTNLNLRDVFQVAKPFPVQSSTIMPFYGMPGLGTQFVTPLPIQVMLDRGILLRVVITIP